MEFKNEFDVKAPIEEVYTAMLDLERVAPAMPGAQVIEKKDDDHYKVAIKVKVGPISMQYRGDVEIADKDPENHSAKIKVQARETRGQGTASADVLLKLDPNGDDASHGEMTSSVQLAGRAAAMGGGVIKDVSAKLVDQFARNLGELLGTQEAPAPEKPAAPETPQSGTAPASGGAQTPAGAGSAAGQASATKAGDKEKAAAAGPASSSGASTFEADDEGVDALGIAASVAGDKLRDPRVLLGSLGLVLLIGWLLRRRS